jgi:hypothetical protein
MKARIKESLNWRRSCREECTGWCTGGTGDSTGQCHRSTSPSQDRRGRLREGPVFHAPDGPVLTPDGSTGRPKRTQPSSRGTVKSEHQMDRCCTGWSHLMVNSEGPMASQRRMARRHSPEGPVSAPDDHTGRSGELVGPTASLTGVPKRHSPDGPVPHVKHPPVRPVSVMTGQLKPNG